MPGNGIVHWLRDETGQPDPTGDGPHVQEDVYVEIPEAVARGVVAVEINTDAPPAVDF